MKMDELEEIKQILKECDQSHVLRYWSDLNDEDQQEFREQLKTIDFRAVASLWKKGQEDMKKNYGFTEDDYLPVDVEIEKDIAHSVIEEYRNIGLDEISKGTVAVVVLAGGQGTRLGLPYPKGMCPTGLPSAKTLFQLQAERMLRLMELAKEKTGKQGIIHWYIMTSEATDLITRHFLNLNNYLGLDKNHVKLFKQAQLPIFNSEGKIVLEEKFAISMAPDGNGGIYKALIKEGILDDMESKGVKYIHVHTVDNILIRVADPVFLGRCIKDKFDFALKVIKRTDPKDCVGLVVSVYDKIRVLEYSEVVKSSLSLRRYQTDELVFENGNICIHYYDIDFMRKFCTQHEEDLRIHLAQKSSFEVVGPDGDKILPPFNNCIKLEKFIFDAITYADNVLVWRVEKCREFSPVKNSDTIDTYTFPTARRDLMALHKTWVENMGGKCLGLGVEVSPLLSYDGEGLEHVKGKEFKDGEELKSEKEDVKVKSNVNSCNGN